MPKRPYLFGGLEVREKGGFNFMPKIVKQQPTEEYEFLNLLHFGGLEADAPMLLVHIL